MSKYDKMLEVNHKQSVEKIQRAKLTIQEMIEEEDKVTVPKLIQKTGLSRGFFYKNPEVRKAVDHALQVQAGMVDKRRKILDMAMDNRILQLEQQVAKLKRENETLRKENEAMRKALNKKRFEFDQEFLMKKKTISGWQGRGKRACWWLWGADAAIHDPDAVGLVPAGGAVVYAVADFRDSRRVVFVAGRLGRRDCAVGDAVLGLGA